MVLLFSCNSTDKKEVIHYYYKATKEGRTVAFEKRSYIMMNDSITKNLIFYMIDSDDIHKSRIKYIKSENGLEIVINKKVLPFLQFSKEEPCTFYEHPMGYDIKNCYIETVNYKGYDSVIKYDYSQEIIDGLSMTIYLDKDFALIDKMGIIGFSNYDELIRIEKDSIPVEVQKILDNG